MLAVEEVEEGVIASVASSEGTERILRRRGWTAVSLSSEIRSCLAGSSPLLCL